MLVGGRLGRPRTRPPRLALRSLAVPQMTTEIKICGLRTEADVGGGQRTPTTSGFVVGTADPKDGRDRVAEPKRAHGPRR